jgi:acetyl-CoA acetyltransferase
MTREEARKRNLEILGIIRTHSVVGVEPSIMGIGAKAAIEKVLDKSGMNKDEIDLYEINEAFACVPLHAIKELELPIEKVNVNGGAIAMGHALGNTGCRLVVSIVHELKRRNGRYGLVSMCVGSGQGVAVLIEREKIMKHPVNWKKFYGPC